MKNFTFLLLLILISNFAQAFIIDASVTKFKNGHKIKRNDKVHIVWEMPENYVPQQTYFKIFFYRYDTLEFDTPAALINSQPEVFYEETTNITMIDPNESWGKLFDPALFKSNYPHRYFAWRVIAYNGDTDEVTGISEAFHFMGPDIIDYFYAGGYFTVHILHTYNNDLEDFAGQGVIYEYTGNEWTDSVVFDFEHLQIDTTVSYVLKAGSTECYDQSREINLEGLNDNGTLSFQQFGHKLTPNGLYAIGKSTWTLPDKIFIDGQEPITLESDTVFLYMVNFNIIHDHYYVSTIALPTSIGDLSFSFDSTTVFISEEYNWSSVRYNGAFEYAFDDQSLSFKVSDSSQLYYQEYSKLYNDNDVSTINLIKETNLSIAPINFTIDFSQEESPRKMSDDPTWKGIYISRMDMHYSNSFGTATSPLNTNTKTYDLEEGNMFDWWIDEQGIDLLLEGSIHISNPVEGYPDAHLNQYFIHYQDDQFIQAQFNGKIDILGTCPESNIDYTLTFNEKGEQEAQIGDLHTVNGPCLIDSLHVEVTTEFTIKWSPVTNAIGYEVSLTQDDFTTFVSNYELVSTEDTTFRFTDLFLIDDATYQFRVRAIFDNAHSNYSFGTMIPSEISSVEDINNSNSLELYPNPAKDRIQLISNDPTCQIQVISIQDMNGKVHALQVLENNSMQHQLQINLLPKGVYITKIRSNKGSTFKKFIKY